MSIQFLIMNNISKRSCVGCLLLLFLITACTVQKSPVTGSNRAYGYSWEEEKKLGAQSDKQIMQQYGVYPNEDLQQYISNIGHDILSVSHMRREDTPQKYKETEFEFKVLNTPAPNAFALPGGYVYVTRGMLAHLENEAQLAVVLGHEIGHVAARHASQRAFEQQVGQVALLGGAIAGEELLGVPGGTVLNLGGQAAQLLFMSYSRDDERESDRLGVEYAAKQNYEAADGAGFFTSLERLSDQSGQSVPVWQSTHPDPGARSETIPELAQKWREKGYEQNIENTDRYMNHIDGIIYGNNPREGFAENGTFYHPELAFMFQYPSDWNIINQPNMVAVVTEEQDAVSIMEIDSKSESPRASVSAFVGQKGFTVRGQGSAQNNGMNAYEAVATAKNKQGNTYQFYVYAVEYDGNIYRFTSYTTVPKFSQYESEFAEISNSFDELNDEDILQIQPVRLEVRKANHSGTISSFLPDNLPQDITEEDVAILNQVKLDETVEEGNWIKIPRQ